MLQHSFYNSLPLIKLKCVCLVGLLCLLSFLFLPTEVHSQYISAEEKIKASFVFNIIRFVKWPDDKLKATDSIHICVFNYKKNFIKAFQPIVGKRVNGHPIILNNITHAEKIDRCHLVYIEQQQQNNLTTLFKQISKNQILSISDIENFCITGGMIGLVKKKEKIRIEINLQAIRTSNIVIGSNLLEIATIVQE